MIKEGKILKALSGFYYVQCQDELITCRARGNFRNDNITPLVGDDVKIQMSDNNTGYVVEILERKNELLRPKAPEAIPSGSCLAAPGDQPHLQ